MGKICKMLRRLANIVIMTVLLLGPALLLRYVSPSLAAADWSMEHTTETTDATLYVPEQAPR